MSFNMKSMRSVLVLAFLLFVGSLSAQTVKVTVKDSQGEAVIGASVIEQGTRNGGVTDFDGIFTIKLTAGKPIVVSYIGMKPKTVNAKGDVTVVLEDDATTLQEVVAIGYGTMKRKDLTGSVSSVTGDKLAAVPVANVSEALQGKLGGVNVVTQDGRPGATQAIVVRGGGSITQSNDPLFVVDGVIVDQIDDIPADQIESIDVLKDASSTAIYGARGANGVILVTTKTAKEGKPQIKYGMYYQIQAKPKLMDTESAYDIVMRDWSYSMTRSQNEADNIAEYYGLGAANNNHLNEYKSMGTHNWVDDITQTGHMWNHDFSISGGTDKTKYFASVNYMSNKGTLMNSGYTRWNINLKLQQELLKNLTLDLNARYSETSLEGNDNAYAYASQAYRYAPIDNILGTKDASLLGSSAYDPSRNPLDLINDISDNRKTQRVSLNSALTWKAFKGFVAKTELYVGRHWSQQETWQGGHYLDFDSKYVKNAYSTATQYKRNGYSTRWDTTLSYDVQGLGENHSLNVMVGNEVLGSKSSTFRFTGYDYPTEWSSDRAFANPDMYNSKYGTIVKNNVGAGSHTISWFGRMNYNLLGRYMFTFTMRADGSSKFAKDNRWGYFPAGAVAWRISDEPFLAGAQKWLDNLKLRLSIGTSGNDGIDEAAFYTSWKSESQTVNGETVKTYEPVTTLLGNPDLKWETTISRNIGLDFSFLNGKFNGSVDFYWNTTKDCLMLVPCNATSGFQYQMQNIAKTSNKGIELAFNYNIIRKNDFTLNFGINYNYNVNNVDKLIDGVNASADARQVWGSTLARPTNDYLVKEGEPVGLIQGFQSAGFYTVDDFTVDANGVWTLKEGVADCKVGTYTMTGNGAGQYKVADGQNAFPGMPKYANISGDDNVVDENDVTIIGRTKPKHTGGFNLNGSYKGFDLSANFTYQLDGKVYNANAMHDMYNDKTDLNGWARVATVADCWKSFNVDANGDIYLMTDPAELRAVNANAKYGVPFSNNGVVSSDYIESAAFLRLQSITIGYTLPKNLVAKAGISNARVYFTAGNLFCITGYKGIDPEVNVTPNADSSYSGFPTTNFDYRSYPRSRTFTFGLNVAF
ncbi:MAG: TonB-dependent receptor [Prevotella sp.]|nr:TonB-dependent receptor [Prevotella sp.]